MKRKKVSRTKCLGCGYRARTVSALASHSQAEIRLLRMEKHHLRQANEEYRDVIAKWMEVPGMADLQLIGEIEKIGRLARVIGSAVSCAIELRDARTHEAKQTYFEETDLS